MAAFKIRARKDREMLKKSILEVQAKARGWLARRHLERDKKQQSLVRNWLGEIKFSRDVHMLTKGMKYHQPLDERSEDDEEGTEALGGTVGTGSLASSRQTSKTRGSSSRQMIGTAGTGMPSRQESSRSPSRGSKGSAMSASATASRAQRAKRATNTNDLPEEVRVGPLWDDQTNANSSKSISEKVSLLDPGPRSVRP